MNLDHGCSNINYPEITQMKKLYFLTLVALGFSANSFAQSFVTATSTATIITPISIAKNLDMNFGNIAVNPTTPGGTVILSASASPVRTPTVGLTLPAVTGLVQAASFTVTGEGSSVYTITLPNSISLTGPGAAMAITPNCSVSTLTSAALTGGTQVFYVGGTLTVAAVQVAGAYSGTFSVNVNYN